MHPHRHDRFEIGMIWEIDGIETWISVSGIQKSTMPAIKHGASDRWAPADGGDIEDIEIHNRRGIRMARAAEDILINDDLFIAEVERRLDL